MFDLPHAEIAHQFHPTYSLVEQEPFNPAFSWVQPLVKPEALITLAFAEAHIEQLCRMQPDWDGYGGLRVNNATKYNSLASLRGILLHAPSPDITPNPNGTLSFEWETNRGEAHLEIGQTKLSFYLDPVVGEPIFIDATASDVLLSSIKIGILISANLFPLQHGTISLTKVSLAANVSSAY